jgi:hypothetical protein
MKKIILARSLVFLSTTLISILLFQTATEPVPPPVSQPAAPTPPPAVSEMQEPQYLSGFYADADVFFDGDVLYHDGYKVMRDEEFADVDGRLIPVSYVVLKKNNRTVATFNGLYFPLGNDAKFGLFPFVGDESEQLVVSLTVPRGGRHWVVSLQPKFQILFDSGAWGVGQEDVFVVDIDKDRIYEICLSVTAFYELQDKLSMSEIPLPQILFKYDAKQKKYLPANHLFPDYALRHLKDHEGNSLSPTLHSLLDYIYAGREKDGWILFDERYRSPDKEEIRSRVNEVLKDEPVYQYLYRQRQR